ncbi:Integral membrane sensor signal transduction histidine kinase [Thiocapsa sp. KS1]|nr:Integral membrane sensor signal transduction histidine kinase [Thiocapsa sp. KS1]
MLVLFSNNRLLPANVEGDRGLQETLPAEAELSTEFLDAPRFMGASYDRILTTFLRAKYGSRPPAAVVAAGPNALFYLLRNRGGLFPSVPIVHMGVPDSNLSSDVQLPPDVLGVPISIDFSGTIELALRLRPDARRLVLVTGASPQDRQFETQLRADVSKLTGLVDAEFLAGLPAAVVLKRLAGLGDDAVVVTPGWFLDGEGHEVTPRRSVELMADAATAPIFGTFDTFMGSGVVGGAMVDFRAVGRVAGQAVARLLGGSPPTALGLPRGMPTTLQIDWLQVLRWQMDPDAIPAGAEVRFRPPSFLSEHRNEAIAAALVFLLQSALIAGLLAERHRRRLVELAVQRQRAELAHASRLAVVGELAGAIAHEINQPLGAILSNAEAADLLLQSGANRPDELRTILADIRRNDLRAGEVIRRLRALIAKQAVERQPFDLNEALADVELILRSEARRRLATLVFGPIPASARLIGDRVQIQQVLVNLALNAMDAVADLPDDRRTIQVSVAREPGGVVLSVSDRGPGIAPEHVPRLFDSFFSTKRWGMGLGLSIARTIVESHGGRIWAENAPGGGAAFHVALPVLLAGNQETPASP